MKSGECIRASADSILRCADGSDYSRSHVRPGNGRESDARLNRARRRGYRVDSSFDRYRYGFVCWAVCASARIAADENNNNRKAVNNDDTDENDDGTDDS